MWLEQFGIVDQNIFFGFCAVVFVVLVFNIAVIITRICHTIPAVPGQSLTFFNILSSILISVSVLFRGLQPAWVTSETLQVICQVFTPALVLGYTLFAAALFVRVWMLLLALRWEKNTVEWLGHFVLWVILVAAAVLIITWEFSYPPNTHPAYADMETNSSTTTVDRVVTDGVYECRGWLVDGSRDIEQFAWRLATTCFMAVLLLLAVTALPFFACIPMSRLSKWVRVNVVSLVLVTVNSLCCVIAGVVVWYQYNPTPLSVNDNNKYAIIGSLQLWMIVVSVAALFITELITARMRPSSNVNGTQKQSFSSNYSANKREMTSNDVVHGRDAISYSDDVTRNPQRSTYLNVSDDDDTLKKDRRSYDVGQTDAMEQMEIDNTTGTNVDPGMDTLGSGYRTSLAADED